MKREGDGKEEGGEGEKGGRGGGRRGEGGGGCMKREEGSKRGSNV